MAITTRKMSDAHEDWLVETLGGAKTRGSGNQWRAPADGRHNPYDKREWPFAWDGKSTFAKSASVNRDMWEKIREQARPNLPLIPLRFYDNEKLEVGLDLVVLDAQTFADILEAAEQWKAHQRGDD